MQFNEAQIQAIQHNTGPCMVIAGPGSGKTTVLTHRVRYLIERYGVNPSDILVITFTKAAAEQMKLKFKGLSEGRNFAVTFGTFHAVFFTILKAAYNYSAHCIIKPQIQHEFVKDQMCRLELEYDDENEAVAGVLSEISCVKGEAVNIDEYESRCIPPQSFRIMYRAYDDMLVRKHLIDFDDMIVQCRELLMQREDYRRAWQNKYKYILIDEFQDILNVEIHNNGENISGGQRVRLELARFLLREKDILLADEVTSALDEKNSRLVRDLIFSLPITVLEIAHHIDEEERYDQILELRKG